MISLQVKNLASSSPGVVIPKPESKSPFFIKGMGSRRGEAALIYTVPSHTRSKPYEKGITLTEFERAYKQLQEVGTLDRSWFNENLPLCAKEGGCNFTTIGGVFQMMGIAEYSDRGQYVALNRS